jgi:SAM-dependent methyltransferase
LPGRVAELIGRLEAAPDASVLDYGCAEIPYRDLFGSGVRFEGADIPGNPHATIELERDGSLPVPDQTFDAVISTQVLEHVADPARYLSECHRVLRPGGKLLLSTHGIMVYHPDPDDYWRWTCAGLRLAVEDAGFDVEHFEGIMGLAATGIQLTQDAVYWRAPRALQPLIALIGQTLVGLVDRFERPESRSRNALVFALIAQRR